MQLSYGESFVLFLLAKGRAIDFLFPRKSENFVEFLSDDHWCSKLACLADIFHELNLFNRGIQGRNKNILSSIDKINAFQKKSTIRKKRIAAGNLEMFPSILKRNCTTDLESLKQFIDKS